MRIEQRTGRVDRIGQAMRPGDAVVCISKCLDFCRSRQTCRPDEPAGQPQAQASEPASEYLSIKQAATVTGLSPTKIRREIKAGRLAASDTGTPAHPHYRIFKSDLQTWMERNRGGSNFPPRIPTQRRKVQSRYFGEM